MTVYHFDVDVDCASLSEAITVLVERLGHDEEYGFPYTVDFNTTPIREEEHVASTDT